MQCEPTEFCFIYVLGDCIIEAPHDRIHVILYKLISIYSIARSGGRPAETDSRLELHVRHVVSVKL